MEFNVSTFYSWLYSAKHVIGHVKPLVNLHGEGISSELSLRKVQVVIGFHSMSGQFLDMFCNFFRSTKTFLSSNTWWHSIPTHTNSTTLLAKFSFPTIYINKEATLPQCHTETTGEKKEEVTKDTKIILSVHFMINTALSN